MICFRYQSQIKAEVKWEVGLPEGNAVLWQGAGLGVREAFILSLYYLLAVRPCLTSPRLNFLIYK